MPQGPATLTGCGSVVNGTGCAFQGSNFLPDELVSLTRDGDGLPFKTVQADQQGGFSTSHVWLTAPGNYTVTARGQESGVSVSVSFTIISQTR